MMASQYFIGQRLSFDNNPCTVRYIGPVEGTQNEWLGVEWDYADRGKHDGEHKGVRYFTTKSPSKMSASFVRPSRKPDSVESFVEAVHYKYATEDIERRDELVKQKEIEISGKTVYEVGFDKIRAQLAELHQLKIVILDGMRIVKAESEDKRIRDVCPRIVELDLSRNLFQSCKEIVKICGELDALKNLRINGNRLEVTQDDFEDGAAQKTFAGITELGIDEMLLSWEETCLLTKQFKDLTHLEASKNNFSSLPTGPSYTLPPTITHLQLEYNSFTSLSDLLPLARLPNLQSLLLKGNSISSYTPSISPDEPAPVFPLSLTFLDLSYNQIASWSFINALPLSYPGLTSLRISHNPIYDAPPKPGDHATVVDEGYMLTLARLPQLTTLNFSTIMPPDRTNAEMFYLSRIGREMASVPEAREEEVTKLHPRFKELCEVYGEPVVPRKGEIVNPSFLDARLIEFTFTLRTGEEEEGKEEMVKVKEVPRGWDVYRLKGVVGRLFGVRPLGVRLVWETGEWDPVVGFEEGGDDSGEEEEAAVEQDEKGKWMERQVELEDGTRIVGNMIDGMEAKVRVELI